VYIFNLFYGFIYQPALNLRISDYNTVLLSVVYCHHRSLWFLVDIIDREHHLQAPMDLDHQASKRTAGCLHSDGGDDVDIDGGSVGDNGTTNAKSKRQKTSKSSVHLQTQSSQIDKAFSEPKKADDAVRDDTQTAIKSCRPMLENTILKAEIASLRSTVGQLTNKADFLLSFVGVTEGQPGDTATTLKATVTATADC
jgi:hypothetical protein